VTAVDYDFRLNRHTEVGARKGMSYLLANHQISSILDVGTGTGAWLLAARKHGIEDILGVDGVGLEGRDFCVPKEFLQIADLTKPLELGRTFDAALCLEVAEHLPSDSAETLIHSLCKHADLVFFSAAAPLQNGYGHINCQWPSYWQALFNRSGFACTDGLRFAMWTDADVEPWYRQNIFIARRDQNAAGREPRLLNILHPDMAPHMSFPDSPFAAELRSFQDGNMRFSDYVRVLIKATRKKIARRVIPN